MNFDYKGRKWLFAVLMLITLSLAIYGYIMLPSTGNWLYDVIILLASLCAGIMHIILILGVTELIYNIKRKR